MPKTAIKARSTASTADYPSMRFIARLLLTICPVACSASEPSEFAFTVLCLSDSDAPLSDVPVEVDGKTVGTSDRSGLLRVRVRGAEGETVRLAAICPQGYRESRLKRRITLRRFGRLDKQQPAGGPKIVWRCHPARRLAALVVGTHGRSGIPVIAGGREVARTGPHGTAHALFELLPGSSLTVALDTEERPRLRPRSPRRSFRLEDRDTLWIFEQRFSEKRIRRRRKSTRAQPQPQVPYRIR